MSATYPREAGWPTVSIITPTYNRAGLLRETIDSVLAQDYPHIEYLVFDDGSSDGTRELLEQYAGRLRWVTRPNAGETATVNEAFAMVSGELVGVINSDDPLLPGAVRQLVECFRSQPGAVGVYPDWSTIDEAHRFVSAHRLPEYDLASMLNGISWALGPATFFRRDVLERIGGRDPALVYCGDMEFWLRLAAAGPIAHLPRLLATHRVHGDSASLSQLGGRFAREWVRVYRRALDQPGLPPQVTSRRRKNLFWVYFQAARTYCGRDLLTAGRLFAGATWYAAAYGAERVAANVLSPLRKLRAGLLQTVARASVAAVVRRQRRKLGLDKGPAPVVAGRFAVSTRFVPPAWSGQAVVLGRLLAGLPAERYVLVRRPPQEGVQPDFIERLPGRLIDLPRERLLPMAHRFWPLRLLNVLFAAVQRGAAIARALRDERIETLVGCSGDIADPPAAFIAARILGCRYALYFFDDYTEQWWAEPRLRRLVAAIERGIAPGADVLLSPNESMQAELRRRYGRGSAVVRNPAPRTPSAAPVPSAPSRDAGEFRLIFTGAVYHLNYDVLRTVLEAIRSIGDPAIRLHVYSAQPEAEMARQGLGGPHFVLHPHLPLEEAARVQREGDLLLIPFSFTPAARGLVERSATAKLADYLSAARPILALCPNESFLGRYLERHDCGITVARDDAGAVADAIRRLRGDPSLAARLGRNGAAAATEDFSAQRAQEAFMQALEFRAPPAPAANRAANPVSVVQVSGFDALGVQVNGYLLHEYLRDQGHRSRMLVYRKLSQDPDVAEIGGALARTVNLAANAAQKALSLHCILPVLSASLARHPWVADADIVNLQLIHNAQFFSVLGLPGLSAGRRVVLSVHDMFLFTGHCVYSMDCDRWQDGCGQCPDLELPFPIRTDTSALTWALKRRAFDRARLDLVVGSAWQRERVTRSPMLSRFPVHYIPYGVDTRVFRERDRRACREELGIPQDAHVLAFRSVASRKSFKGTDYVERALQHLDPQRETWLLTFDEAGGLASLRGKYRFIEFGWMLDQDVVARALNAADVFLMPSIAEAFGLMAVEAMACGTPVVVFEGTALPETVGAPECGVAVPRDAEALREAIERLLGDPQLRGRLRENGLRRVRERHAFEDYARRYLELYQSLAAQERHRAAA